jgi:hypothetical protein
LTAHVAATDPHGDRAYADGLKATETVVTEAGTTKTLTAADSGKIFHFTNAAGCQVTLPQSLVRGFNIRAYPTNGNVRVSPVSGVSINGIEARSVIMDAGYNRNELVALDNNFFAAIGTLSAYDPDLAAFITATGATNTESLGDLVTYLKAENLWTSSRIYPMRSDQNKGSGATVYGLGGLTSNNLSLVNSPTWGASDIDFTVANSYGVASIPAFNNLTQGLVITRLKPAQAATPDGD